MSRVWLVMGMLSALLGDSLAASSVNKQCRDLLKCSIRKKCVNMSLLKSQMSNQNVSAEMYDDIDKATDYGCIFTSGCQDECNKCPLCYSSKLQLVEILAGDSTAKGECPELIACASKCVAQSNMEISEINRCLRHVCAFHCFDGSCPKCSAFVTRVFNQMCVVGDFRNIVAGFKDLQGMCFELFRDVVHAKFADRFDAVAKKPSIG